jgi:hypothetical protein
MTAPWWRRWWCVLNRLLKELICLHPAAAAFFRNVAVEDAAEEVVGEVVGEVVSAPRAA